jgi:hypothetical protein
MHHPPYSPERGLPDFCLFEKVENNLIGKSIQHEYELFAAAIEILSSIPTTELGDVFATESPGPIFYPLLWLNGEYLSSKIFSNFCIPFYVLSFVLLREAF